MALVTLLGGSTLGASGGLLAWLLFGVSAATAFGFYLACGVLMPVTVIAISLLVSPGSRDDVAHAEPAKALAA
ncbi:hypothetical protein [Phaeobacter sp. J2-8]|uniref:hypothetical protein n=1 Tax=Phaeobacter sp. J2-8 TaxID=2931394 RepID=UPI001FD53CFD|nr:hypothetical protein [Phaeobacter sp. J2-8]MCJ7873077.1 hypothetical protein [Phaeobacter sp. J2-8]